MNSTYNDLEVLGHKILIKPIFIEEKTEWGFDMSGDDSLQREKAGTIRGTLVAIGPTAWWAFDKDKEGWKPWAEVGDEVIFHKHSGNFINHEEEELMLCYDEDIHCIVHKNK